MSMSTIVPTLGRIVYFTLAPWQAEAINKRRSDGTRCIDKHRWESDGTQVHVGNSVEEGQVVPAMVVAVWGSTPESAVNLKLMLDGTDDYWVTSTSVEDEYTDGRHTPGRYHWMPYQVGQAAKLGGNSLSQQGGIAAGIGSAPTA
jgi:hypothetical protein